MAIIFAKDFEDGTLDGFEYTHLYTGSETPNTITVICGDGTAYEGNCYARLATDGDMSYERCRLGKRFSDQNRLLATPVIRYSRLPINGGRFSTILISAYNTAVARLAELELIESSGVKWRFRYWKNGAIQELLFDATLAAMEWLIPQIYVQVGETDGAVELRLNGVVLHSDSGFKNDDQLGADTYYIGLGDKNETGGAATIDLDSLLIEAPEESLPLTITVAPVSASLVLGQSVDFTAQISGGEPPYAVDWIDNANGNVIGTGETYTFIANQVGNFEIYAKVTDNAGTMVNSSIVSITVSETPVKHILSVNSTPITGVPITIEKVS